MSLATFIQEHHQELIEEWVAFARSLLPAAKEMSERDLRDHAEALLTAVARDMELPESRKQRAEKSQGMAPSSKLGRVGQTHAALRLDSGFRLAQVVAEYRALRASVLRLWEDAHGQKQDDVTRFNEALDEALTESAVRYAELINQTKEQFLAVLAHDLRNPLGAIITGAAFLMASESVDDKAARIAARIRGSAERMSRMVNDLLDLARTRLGSSLPIRPLRTDLGVVCRQVIAELEAIHPDCRVKLESEGDLTGEWDGDRLTQVVSNLVANAVQYGCESGPVWVATRDDGDQVVLSVNNKGPLITEDMQATLFEPMVRHATSCRDKNPSGLGLGLFIVREVLKAHGGTICVTSNAEEGTTFTVRLPRHTGATETQHTDWASPHA